MRTQLNVRLAKSSKNKVQVDRKNFRTTNDIIVAVALEDFFTRHTPDQRRQFYRNHDWTPYARAK